ncbi:MAG TPA: tRNA pseudouridine(38-40) synthase TruA [Anaerolineae bacterium]
MYVRATIAYDGTDFFGFQWQTGTRTVQGAVEAALAEVAQAATRVIGSGRTDTGVHALGQVIGFQVVWRHSLADLQRALNAVLPDDVAVLDLAAAAEGWHPRFSARRRHYRYTVLNVPLRSPLDRRYSHQVAQRLDLAALNQAAALLVGTHDFASFGRPTQGESTTRTIFSAGWQKHGDRLVFDVVGNAFLRSMVRSLVGSQLQVGLGTWSLERLAAVLDSRDRALAAPPAPACGLCLIGVDYDDDMR